MIELDSMIGVKHCEYTKTPQIVYFLMIEIENLTNSSSIKKLSCFDQVLGLQGTELAF